MKRIVVSVTTTLALLAVVVLARDPRRDTKPLSGSPFTLTVEDRNPWTNLKVATDPQQYHFAFVSDRTGGHRAGIFSRAVEQINLMKPAFVVSVGDIIEGSTEREVNRKQWQEIEGYLAKLTVPFFYAPGNHDAANLAKAQVWKERFGRSYYHFRYKDTLFLILNCFDNQEPEAAEAQKKGRRFSDKQLEFIKKALAENADVRWTFAVLHVPIWTSADVAQTGWLDIEKMLEGRKYSVFCGHIHTYRKYVRNGMNYYQLATTGGGSSLRGPSYGEFDQIAWITMTADGPVMANIQLDGILPDDLAVYESSEDGRRYEKPEGLVAVRGRVTLAGKPLAGGTVSFYTVAPMDPQKTRKVGDSRIEADGSFEVYRQRGTLGLAPGNYMIEVGPSRPIVVSDRKLEKSEIPQKYRSHLTSGLRVDIVAGRDNTINLELR